MSAPGQIPKHWSGYAPAQRPPAPTPGDFNLDAPDVRLIRIPLDNANTRRELNITGNLIWCIRASSPDALALFHINKHEADGIPITEGLAFRTPNYQRIYVENTAQAGAWLDIVYFTSHYDFFAVNPGSIVSTVTLAKPTSGSGTAFSIAVNTTTAVAAADATRHYAIIKNEGPDWVRVAWNGTGISDSEGIQLFAGESITLEGTAGIDVRNPSTSAAAAAVNILTAND